MKKVWIVLLTIYVMLVTVGCAVFATLYFLGDGTLKNLTYSEAKILVHKAYETQVKNAGGASVFADELEYKEYPEDEFDYTYVSMPLATYKIVLTSFDAAFQSDVSVDVWHKDEETKSPLGINTEAFRMKIKGQSVILELLEKSSALEGSVVQPGENLITHYFEIKKVNENSWNVDYYERYYNQSSETSRLGDDGKHFMFWHFNFQAENDKLFLMHLDMTYSYLSVLKEELSQNDFYAFVNYECNLKTHKVLMGVTDGKLSGGLPDYCQNLNAAESLSYAQDLYKQQKSLMGLYLDNTYLE